MYQKVESYCILFCFDVSKLYFLVLVTFTIVSWPLRETQFVGYVMTGVVVMTGYDYECWRCP